MENGKKECNVEGYMYKYLEDSNKGFENDYILSSMNVRITTAEFQRRRDLYAKGLLELGVQKGDIVSVCMPNTIESVIMLYAINKIGAVSNYVNVLKEDEYIRHCINNVNSKVLIAFDGVMNKILSIVDRTTLDKVVYASAFESMPKLKKSVIEFLAHKTGKIEKYTDDRGYTSWKDFLVLSANSDKEIIVPEFVRNQASFIEYTSGTTNIPKTIELTNESANEKARIYGGYRTLTYQRGEKYINIIPLFVAFGIVIGVHVPMSIGCEAEQVLSFKNEDLFKYLKNKPEHWFLTPSSFSYLVSDPKFAKLDLSKTKTAGCGGDGLNEWQNIIVEEKMRQQGFKYHITNGFGASELGAPFSTCTYELSKPGSVGLPLPGNEIIIFKPGTMEKLGPNEVGDICMVANYPMNGYYNNPEETEKAMITLDDGRKAMMLGDMGYVDEDGFIFVKGRKTDILESNIGQLWPIDLESFIMSSREVDYCAVSYSPEEGRLLAYIETDESRKDKVIEKLKIMFENSEEYKDLNIDFQYVDKIPLTFTGKIYRKQLKLNSQKI